MGKSQNFFDLEEIRNEVFSGKISKAYVYQLAKKGKIKTVRVGKRILVSASEAERLLTEGVQ
jgi:excisionase family DNA binding protein